MLVSGCRDWFLMPTPYCTLERQRFGLRMIGMLLASHEFILILFTNYTKLTMYQRFHKIEKESRHYPVICHWWVHLAAACRLQQALRKVCLEQHTCKHAKISSIQFSPVPWPTGSTRGHGGWFSRGPLPVFFCSRPLWAKYTRLILIEQEIWTQSP